MMAELEGQIQGQGFTDIAMVRCTLRTLLLGGSL